MDLQEFQTIGDFLEAKSVLLWKHEKSKGINRTYAKTNFDETKFHEIKISNRRFFVVCTNVFHQILNSVLADACEKYPECFGTGNASDVLCALYKIEAFGSISDFQNFLSEEQFAWIVEISEGHVRPKILRIELFRKIDNLNGDETKTEFTGGVFHSFRHFHYKDVPLSTKKEKGSIDHPSSIIELLISGFFFSELKQKDMNGEKLEAKVTNEDSKYCFAFFFEKESQTHFVNSVRFD